MADEEIVMVEIPPEGTEIDAEGKEIPAAAGIADLKKQVEETNARAAADAERARVATAENAALRGEVDRSQQESRTNAIELVKGELATHKAAYKEALEAGEYDKVSDLNEKIAIAATKLDRLENAPATERRAAPPAEEKSVEGYLAKLSPPAAAWMRAHPSYITDPKLNKMVLSAHYKADAEGYVLDSPDYFAYIERSMLGNQSPPPPPPPPPEVRRQAPTTNAAPVSRDPPNGNGQPQRQAVSLTREEVDMAKMMGQTPAEYAKAKMQLEAEGRLHQQNRQ